MRSPDFKLSNGMMMPAFGFGTFRMDGPECEQAVRHALKVGYRHIDTADYYFNHDVVGKAIGEYDRSDIFLTTKVWYDQLQHDQVLSAVDRFLEELNTPYIDLLLIHWPNSSVPMEETFAAMTKLHADGKLRAVGVSNFTMDHLEQAIGASDLPIVNNQVEFNVYLYQKDLLEFCKRHEILLTAYRPLVNGEVSDDPTLREIAGMYDKTASQVALNWLLRHDVCAIPKSKTPAHIDENWGALGWELADEDVARIDALNRNDRRVAPDFAEFD
jgi:2,5-diketo-D-gluconate reductase B